MAAAFLLVLVLAWVVVCLPAANRARERSPLTSTRLFRRALDLIGSENHGRFLQEFGGSPAPKPRPVVLAQGNGSSSRPPGPSIRRIPTFILCLLVAGALVTAGLALVRGGSMWEIHLATDGALAIFISLLLEEKHRKDERRRKVRILRARHLAQAQEATGLQLVAGAE